MVQSKSVIFGEYPDGFPEPGKTLKVETSEVDVSKPPQSGVIVKTLSVSLDPYMRGMLRSPEVKRYSTPYKIGQPLYSLGVGKVTASDNDRFAVDSIIGGSLFHTEYHAYTQEDIKTRQFKHVDNPHNFPIERFLGVLGMPGMTAYSSLYELGELHRNKEETIFISAASGAVGSLVGQLAKREGLRVVGSAGTDEKVTYLLEKLKFDAAFNYKTTPVHEALQKHIPEGLDIYYDNVGGETLEAALENAKQNARFIECGMISQYNVPKGQQPYGVKNLFQLIGKRIRMQGFLVSDLWPKYNEEFYKKVGDWLENEEIHYREDVATGIDDTAAAFVRMLKGENFSKQVVKYADA